ncbi:MULTISPECIES: hypothetical protein [Virgibacillus]|uniref:hypothetical protein n=1 Tax=Virgibacillus TaxID=84406 RepID=UPI0013CEE81D|nr:MULTISPECIES: hypothetical protein [Virgibacillus]
MNYWTDYLPDWRQIYYTAIAFVIPFLLYQINKRLHHYGDPSWKKDNADETPQEDE